MRTSRCNFVVEVCAFLLAISILSIFIRVPVYSQASWPASWIQIDWDKNEDGWRDDWRDVEYAYYQYDSAYLYLKLKCYDLPGKEWAFRPDGDARYKWFIDLDGNMHFSGENIFEAEYLLFVEDTDEDASGEMYLLYDATNNGNFHAYEPWPPANSVIYKVTNPIVGGWRIVPPYQIEMYISWVAIGSPSSYWITWATDQENPNLDQGPTTDHPDEEKPIAIHDVAALSQIPSPTTVTQGDHVNIQVVVENQGTQTESFDVTCYFDTSVVGTLHVTNLAAGHSTTLSFDWDTAGVPPATYAIKAWADSGAVITETDEKDNWCTATATVTIKKPKVHDVAATSQDPDQNTVKQGTIVNVNVKVENFGDFPETFDVTCYFDSTAIGTKSVNLEPHDLTIVSFAWDTTGVSSGVYYIKAVADFANAITEVDEKNNVCTSIETVTVYIPTEPGKLFIDKAETAVISGPDPPVAGFPTVYELTITVTNPGGSDVNNIVAQDTISSDVTFVSVGTPSKGFAIPPTPPIVWNVGTLTPGASGTLTFRVNVTSSGHGLLYLNHKGHLSAYGIDSSTGNPVQDTGHTDVTATSIIRDVRAVSQIPSSTIVNQGETISIKVTVQNLGDQAESFYVTCYSESTQIGRLRSYSLSPGDIDILTFAWDTSGVTPRTYDIKAKADSDNEIAESNEGNNECSEPAAVKIVIHNIAAISQTPSPTAVHVGETVTIKVVVQNQGTEPETFTVECCYDSSQIGGPQTVTNLPPSTSTILTFTWDTTGVATGTYYISATASTVPSETDTNDNACTGTTTVAVCAPGYTITFLTDPSTIGSITFAGTTYTHSQSGQYAAGSYSVSANAPSGYSFSSWVTTGGVSISGSAATVTGDGTVKALFKKLAPPPVGGKWIPINKSALLAPWIGLGSVTALLTASFVYVKRKKRQMS